MKLKAYMQVTWVVMAGFLIVSGCGSTPPTQFYTLSPLHNASLQATGVSRSNIAIGVGPITVPDFLDRPQIVTRTTTSQLDVNEYHRWGGSLQEDFTRVLVDNLSRLLATDHISAYPSLELLDLQYRFVLDVQQFDGRLGEGVTLSVIWTLLDERAGKPIRVQRFTHTEPVTLSSYSALVVAHSAALAALSRELANAIPSAGG